MLFSVFSIGRITGAGMMLAGVLLCAALYLALSLLPRGSRSKAGVRTVLLGLLVSELACDLLWYVIYFPGGEYRNYGIGGVYGVLLWPLALLITGGIAASVNSDRG